MKYAVPLSIAVLIFAWVVVYVGVEFVYALSLL